MKSFKIVSILMTLILGVFLAPLASDILAFGAGIEVHPAICAIGYGVVNIGLSLVNIPLPSDILMFNVGHVLRTDSASNPSGVQTLVYWAYNADVDNYPGLVSSPSTSAERITLESSTGFSFLAGKSFNKLSVELEAGEVLSEPVGENGGQNYLNKATLIVSGTDDDVTALGAELKNSQTTWVIPEQSGDNKVVGSETFPATCKCSFSSGKEGDGRRMLTVEIQAYSPDPAYKYTGPLDVDPSS